MMNFAAILTSQDVGAAIEFMTSIGPHFHGLSHRHAGFLLEKIRCNPQEYKLLLTVVTMRCAKSDLKEIMRMKMREVKTPTDERKFFMNFLLEFL